MVSPILPGKHFAKINILCSALLRSVGETGVECAAGREDVAQSERCFAFLVAAAAFGFEVQVHILARLLFILVRRGLIHLAHDFRDAYHIALQE